MTERGYSVVWTEIAARDVERLAACLLDEAPARAEQILDRIVSRGESLKILPQRGRTPPELRAIGDRTWREAQEPRGESSIKSLGKGPWRSTVSSTGDEVWKTS